MMEGRGERGESRNL